MTQHLSLTMGCRSMKFQGTRSSTWEPTLLSELTAGLVPLVDILQGPRFGGWQCHNLSLVSDSFWNWTCDSVLCSAGKEAFSNLDCEPVWSLLVSPLSEGSSLLTSLAKAFSYSYHYYQFSRSHDGPRWYPRCLLPLRGISNKPISRNYGKYYFTLWVKALGKYLAWA